MNELERLEKKVADTKDAYDDAYAAYDVAYAAYAAAWDDAHDAACDAACDAAAAWTAYRKALQELEDYLKEQDNA